MACSDPGRAAGFYEAVFGWRIRRDGDEPAFSDATGHVIGHFVARRAGRGGCGILPYIYVDDVDATLQGVAEHGGETVMQPRAEGTLRVATFRDPKQTCSVSGLRPRRRRPSEAAATRRPPMRKAATSATGTVSACRSQRPLGPAITISKPLVMWHSLRTFTTVAVSAASGGEDEVGDGCDLRERARLRSGRRAGARRSPASRVDTLAFFVPCAARAPQRAIPVLHGVRAQFAVPAGWRTIAVRPTAGSPGARCEQQSVLVDIPGDSWECLQQTVYATAVRPHGGTPAAFLSQGSAVLARGRLPTVAGMHGIWEEPAGGVTPADPSYSADAVYWRAHGSVLYQLSVVASPSYTGDCRGLGPRARGIQDSSCSRSASSRRSAAEAARRRSVTRARRSGSPCSVSTIRSTSSVARASRCVHDVGDVGLKAVALRSFGVRSGRDRATGDLCLARPLRLGALDRVDRGAMKREARIAPEIRALASARHRAEEQLALLEGRLMPESR